MDRAAENALRFPGAARLELDELLDELVLRADEVRGAQGRLRGLLAANHDVAGGLGLDEVLVRVVRNARALVGARYAALGVVRSGRLVRFVHDGMPPDVAAELGTRPKGEGILGLLIEDPKPLRLDDLSGHPASVGFPAGHPAMTSFLGAPLSARGEIYGNLYLTEKDGGGSFTADDEELLTALAATAGVAVGHALLLDETRQREYAQAAAARLTRELLRGDGDPRSWWAEFLETVLQVADARGAAVTRIDPAEPEQLEIFAAAGALADWSGQTTTTNADTVTHATLEHGDTLLVLDAATDPRTTSVAGRAPEVESVLSAPVATPKEGPNLVLLATRHRDEVPFDEVEREMIGAFAAQAGTVLAVAETRRQREAIRLLEDRERLAHELQESLTVRLSRLGMNVSGLASLVPHERRDRLVSVVDELDAVVRSIRDRVLRVEP